MIPEIISGIACTISAIACLLSYKQLKIMYKEYKEVHRPNISICVKTDFSNYTFLIKNIGLKPATNVKIVIDDNFTKGLDLEKFIKGFLSKPLYIGVNQSIELMFLPSASINSLPQKLAKIDVSYNDQYAEHIEIDLEPYKYLTYKKDKSVPEVLERIHKENQKSIYEALSLYRSGKECKSQDNFNKTD